MFRHFSDNRRRDMAFITTAQGAVLAIIGKNLLSMSLAYFLLSVIAAFLLLTGLNNERRMTAYMRGYMKRAKKIQDSLGMTFLSDGYTEVTQTKALVSNMVMFPFYYALFFAAWIAIWLANVL